MIEKKDKKPKASNTMQYVGLGSQLMVFMGLGAFGGHKLDAHYHFNALFVIIFPLIALVYSLWQIIKTFSK